MAVKKENQGRDGGQAEENQGHDGAEGGEGGEGGEGVEKLVDAKVNAAISNHLTRFRSAFEKDMNKTFKGLLGETMTPLQEAIQNLAAARTQQQEDEQVGHNDARLEVERKKFEARIQELEGRYRESEEARQREMEARQRDEERSALASALSNAGITGAQQRAAIALLYVDQQRLARDADGNIKFIVQKPGYVDEVTLDEGIESWLKTEEGKVFLPPRGAAGSGNTESRAKGGRRQPRSRQEAQAVAKLQLAEALGVLPPNTQQE